LYDIANVLKSLGVIKKQKDGLNKNVFMWIGSQGFSLSKNIKGCNCMKNKANRQKND